MQSAGVLCADLLDAAIARYDAADVPDAEKLPARRYVGHGPVGATAAPANNTGTLVTLALTPDQAPRLIHSLSTGSLYAGLRGSDVKIDTALVVNDANLFNR